MVLVGKNCTLLNELIRSSLKIPAKERAKNECLSNNSSWKNRQKDGSHFHASLSLDKYKIRMHVDKINRAME